LYVAELLLTGCDERYLFELSI